MEKNKTGRKTVNQLCREYEVQNIWELSDVFYDWYICGHSNLVILHFNELRKCERNLLWRWWNANDCYMQLAAITTDIVLPIDKCTPCY